MKHLQQKVLFFTGRVDYRSTKNNSGHDLETFIKLGMATFINERFGRFTFVNYGVSDVP